MFIQARLHPETRRETLAQINKLWEKMCDGREFQYTDMHQKFMQRNKMIITLSKILISYSLIALVLTCFGLFGISWYAVRHRTREIAIRKVNGAETGHIMKTFLLKYMFLLLIASVIAFPIGYLIMKPWIEGYVLQTSIDFWIYPVIWLALALLIITCTGWRIWKAANQNPAVVVKSE